MTDIRDNITENSEDTQKGRFLIFALDEESYGIEIQYISEIVGIQTITRIPELPDYVRGIMNLRGKIIPVMDARLRFKKSAIEYNDRTCIIVVDINDTQVGLIIDSVSEVVTISEENMVDPPQINQGLNNRYIHKIGKAGNDVKLLLDCDMLFSGEEFYEMGI